MKTTKPTISKESELRLKVIDAVCFGPGISGHLEQFERIEALAYNKGYVAGYVEITQKLGKTS